MLIIDYFAPPVKFTQTIKAPQFHIPPGSNKLSQPIRW